MSHQRENYFFLNFQGKCSPPNYQEVEYSDLSSRPFILILDANVCIDISVKNPLKQDKIKRLRVNAFLNYCQTSNITVLPDYGLIEGASQPGTLKLSRDKLIESENTFWRQLGHYENNNRISLAISSIESFKALIYPFYAYLLMIKLILIKRDPSRANMRLNFQDLYDFSIKIGINLALPLQFAIAIFGGETKLNRFISPKKGDVFKALRGAAWDLLYLQLIHEHNGIREKKKGYFPHFILVTDDQACSTIGDFAKVTTILDYGDIMYDEVMMNCDFPHIRSDTNFPFEMFLKTWFDTHRRIAARSAMSELNYQNNIEEIINRAYSLILEITKQIQIHEKKGFG